MTTVTKVIRTKEELAAFNRYTAKFKLDKPIEITIGEYKKKHSRSQRGLYRIWLSEISMALGYDDDDYLHQFFKRRFVTPIEIDLLGEPVMVYTTRQLSTTEYTDYLDAIQRFVATDLSELGIALTQPAERR